MKFEALKEFGRNLKKLSKKYKGLEEDINVVKKVLEVSPEARPPFSYRIDGLGIQTCMIKVKKIACRAMKGKGSNTGFRMVYAHFDEEEKIILVELYHKKVQANEDRERILKNFD